MICNRVKNHNATCEPFFLTPVHLLKLLVSFFSQSKAAERLFHTFQTNVHYWITINNQQCGAKKKAPMGRTTTLMMQIGMMMKRMSLYSSMSLESVKFWN